MNIMDMTEEEISWWISAYSGYVK